MQVQGGHQVTVCTTDRGNPARRILSKEHFRDFYPDTVELKVFPVMYAPLLYSPQMAKWLAHAVETFDVVHVHGVYRFPPTYGAYQARKHKIPYVMRPHGAIDPYLYDKSTTGIVPVKRLYGRFFDLPNLHGAGAIHYTADEERHRAAFLNLKAPAFVVPNGIDWMRFDRLPERGSFRSRLGLGEVPLVLFLGRLHVKKGLDLLIPAFSSVRERFPLAHLAIAGPDAEHYGRSVRLWVQQHNLAESVHFVEHLDGPDVIKAYVDSDVFVLPSYTENFGLAVVEAMACGTPVVISDQVNIHREVAAAGAGLVTRCDSEEIGRALVDLLGDSTRRETMGVVGRRAARERYTWPPIVEALTREYEAVIARTKAARGKEAAGGTSIRT